MKKRYSKKAVCLFMAAWLLVSFNLPTVFAQEKPATKVTHKPLKYFVPGHRIQVEAKISDKAEIKVVRCYFRTPEQADFVFVSMSETEKGRYQGILPAPAPNTENIIYIFLAANAANQVIKTQEFLLKKDAEKEVPPWQQTGTEGNVKVSTELSQAPKPPEGFRDSMLMDQSESTIRLGGASLIYAGIGWGTAAVAAAAAATAAAAVTVEEVVKKDDDDKDTTKPTASLGNYSDDFSYITFVFNEDMNTSEGAVGVEPGDLWQPSNISVIPGYWKNNDEKTLEIRRSNQDSLPQGTQLKFTLTGFKDKAGNEMDRSSFDVTVEGGSMTIEWLR